MNRDEDIFAAARALPPADRAAYLDRTCAGDPALRAHVEALLGGFEAMVGAQPLAFSAHTTSAADEKAGDWIGRYRLQEKLGEGGCGVVWMASQTEPVRRRVALKVIKLGMDTKEVIARFEAERQTVAMMDHPNIAKVFDAGTTDTGRPYFVMELVRGLSLTRFCDEAGLPLEQRLQLFMQVCQAIQHAHQKGIIHRDIKPSNILVAQHDTVAVPKVIDFGIAKAMQGPLTDRTLFTAFSQFIGTPAYMSPEQADFNVLEVDVRSDVYSLGVLLYELVTGQPPFDPKRLQQAGLEEIRRIIREVDPPRPSTRWSTLSHNERANLARNRGTAPARIPGELFGDLDWIVMHCLEKDRLRRYDTAHDLALDLQRHLRHEPVQARPPSAVYRFGKFVRRHRVGVTAAGVVGLSLAAGAVVSLQQAQRADRAEQEATQLKSPVLPASSNSIVVLPFENQSENPAADAFFSDGMHEAVISNLQLMRELRCLPRATAERYGGTKKTYREIGAELGVAHVLTASVRRAGQKVRLTGTLMKAGTNEVVWTRIFDRNVADVFLIQSELAQAIATELKAVLSPEAKKLLERRPTENQAAYDLYLRAREIHSRGLPASVEVTYMTRPIRTAQIREELLGSAVTLDPGFARAWSDLAWVHSDTYGGNVWSSRDRSDRRREKAKAAIGTAVRLAPNDPEVRLSSGYYLQYCSRDYERAAADFAEAARLQPGSSAPLHALAELRRAEGKWTEALAITRQAVAIDPSNPGELYVLLAAGRRHGEVLGELRRNLQSQPSEFRRSTLARHEFFATGSTREMDELVAAAVEKRVPNLHRWAMQHEKFIVHVWPDFSAIDRSPVQDAATDQSWDIVLHIAVIRAARGDLAGARARLKNAPANLQARLALQPDNTTLLCDLACIEAVLGHPEEALRAAKRAVELLPMELDAWQAPQIEENLAFVYAWTGDKTRAIETYARLLQTPMVSPRLAAMSVHVLRNSLWFFPLRGEPRFEALLNDPKNSAPLF